MASFAVAAREIGANDKTLVAATVDTVTFANFRSAVEVFGDGTAALYFTADGTTPTVGGNESQFLPAGVKASKIVRALRQSDGTTVVKLISSGATHYTVSEAPSI